MSSKDIWEQAVDGINQFADALESRGLDGFRVTRRVRPKDYMEDFRADPASECDVYIDDTPRLSEDIWHASKIVAGAGDKTQLIYPIWYPEGLHLTVIISPDTEEERTMTLPVWKFYNNGET